MCGITREHTPRDTTPMPLIIESSVGTTMDEDMTDSESDDGIFIQEPNANDVVAGRGNGMCTFVCSLACLSRLLVLFLDM